jgi:hypothetical protein
MSAHRERDELHLPVGERVTRRDRPRNLNVPPAQVLARDQNASSTRLRSATLRRYRSAYTGTGAGWSAISCAPGDIVACGRVVRLGTFPAPTAASCPTAPRGSSHMRQAFGTEDWPRVSRRPTRGPSRWGAAPVRDEPYAAVLADHHQPPRAGPLPGGRPSGGGCRRLR